MNMINENETYRIITVTADRRKEEAEALAIRLQVQVNIFKKEGWTPQGGVTSMTIENEIFMAQAMVKE